MSMIEGKDAIHLFRLKTLRQGIKLEGRGLRRGGRSCLAIVKEEFNWKGDRKKILGLLEMEILREEFELAGKEIGEES